MKKNNAIGRAWRAYSASPAETARFLLVEACLTLICLAPLLFLTRKGLEGGALLTPLLWIFLKIPARMNAAAAMREALQGGGLGSKTLVEGRNYGAKLSCGLKRGLFLLLWAAPFLILLGVGWAHFRGETDGLTVLRMIKNDLGGGDQMRGILRVMEMLAGSLLILLAGCAFHSGARHAFVRGKKDLVRGRHGKVLGAWLTSLTALLPLIIAVVIAALRYLPAVSDLNMLLMGMVDLPSTRGTVILLLAGALLTLPLLPLRSLIPAAAVQGLEEEA